MTKERYSHRTQAVSNAAETAQYAYWDACDRGEDENLALECEMIAAAALRAAAEQIKPRETRTPWNQDEDEYFNETFENYEALGEMNAYEYLLTIAKELEEAK